MTEPANWRGPWIVLGVCALGVASVPMGAAWAGGLTAVSVTQPGAPSSGEGAAKEREDREAFERAVAAFGGEKAVARPSRDSTISFNFAMEVSEVVVRGGQMVKKGDVLIRTKDDEARFQASLQKILAESDHEIDRAQNALDQAKLEFDAIKQMSKQNTGSKLEFDRAESVQKQREIELGAARLNKKQQEEQLKLREAQLERFTIRAPFDGRVDVVAVEVGEVKRETDPVIRVVKTDPLWIDVQVPERRSFGIKFGDASWTLLDVPGEDGEGGAGGGVRVWPGKVIEVGADVDPSSDTRRVRVEVANPTDLPSGLRSWTRFTAPAVTEGQAWKVVTAGEKVGGKDGGRGS